MIIESFIEVPASTAISKLTDLWAQSTWEEQLVAIKDTSTNEYITQALEKAKEGLLKQKITGESVMGLPQTAEGKFPKGLDMSYSKAFYLAYKEGTKELPIIYLKKLTEAYDFTNYPQSRYEGLIARGLRTFPSLLRDRDFAENLEAFILSKGYKKDQFRVTNDPKQDISEHTDVFLEFKGSNFRIWLYQFSPRGLPHDVERVSGKRGELPNGIHILCPLKTKEAEKIESFQRKEKRCRGWIQEYNRRLSAVSDKKSTEAIKLGERIESWDKKMSENKEAFDSFSASANEIRIQNCWYFYSDRKVETVFNLALELHNNKLRPDNYPEIQKMLLEPENYLGETRAFLKTN